MIRTDRVRRVTGTFRASVLAAVVVVLAVAVTGCGSPDAGQPVSAGGPAAAGAASPGGAPIGTAPAPSTTTGPTAPPQGPSAAAGPLPTLPPSAQRDPQRYDAQGCVRTGPTTSQCESTAAETDAAAAGTSSAEWRTLAGFVGPHFTTDLRRGALTLLEPTISVTTAGPWRANGLARSERADVVPGIRVTATLVGVDGAVLEAVSADSPVAPVRPGEPVPFSLAGSTPAASVARVDWSIAATTGAVRGTRQLELASLWTRPAAAPERVDMYLHHDPAGAKPHLVFGSATNVGTDPAAAPQVTLAWLDGGGRVVLVVTAPVATPDGAPASALAAGEAGDFLATVTDPTAAAVVADLTPMLWGAGR